MNYEIVTDEKLLKEFIDWLPALEPHEVYSVNLFARNKYCKEIVHINSVLHTRGGYHILVELDKIQNQYKKTWHKELTSLPGADIKGDGLIPVPGTYQGGFTPFFDPRFY